MTSPAPSRPAAGPWHTTASRTSPALSADDAVLPALAGFGELPDWLAAGMDGERVRAAVAAAAPDLDVQGCEPQRLRAKDDRWLCRYRVSVGPSDRVAREVVLVGELVPPGPRRDRWPAPPGGAGPADDGWQLWLPDLGLALRSTTSDDALPALPALTDAEQARVLVEQALRSAGRTELRVQTCEPDVVRYKPGSRCTVVYRLTYPPERTRPGPRWWSARPTRATRAPWPGTPCARSGGRISRRGTS